MTTTRSSTRISTRTRTRTNTRTSNRTGTRTVLGVFLVSLALACASSSSSSSSSWNLTSTFNADNFFDEDSFAFFTDSDPTHGYVEFVGKEEALEAGLIHITPANQVYIGTDMSSVVGDGASGRRSIRLSSVLTLYEESTLLVIDLEHMPSTRGSLPEGCSSWPAFWTVGDDWPNTGEIDIIEYVNTMSVDATTLHTDQGCDQAQEDTSLFTGTWGAGVNNQPCTNCDINAPDQWQNQGCGINGIASGADTDTRTVKVGAAFNALGKGGIFVLEFQKDAYISAFYFERDQIPNDLTLKKPQPESWGVLPYARFELGGSDSVCPSSHFTSHRVIFDNTFCGDWAGSDFTSSCSSEMSCTDYVKFNPSFFEESYWLINFVDVYTQ